MKYKIIEKGNPLAVHSVDYHGERGRQRAQQRIDSGEAARHGWLRKDGTYDYHAQFEVVEDVKGAR